MKSYKDIDEYISDFPADVQEKLQTIRRTIQKVAPEAKEKISYGIPTLTFHGNLVHFAAYKGHIGFYPGSGPIKEFSNELNPYKTSKGTVQFPLDKPIPYDLITKITLAAAKRNLSKMK
jgi:uncharacterized protein YdhG (YjbR/CyaY superfamily)